MSHLYRECLCPSARVLTLGPLTCQSRQGLKSSHLYPMAIKLQSLLSMECRICRGLHCLAINTLAAPSTVASAFPSAKKALPSFLPKERHSLMTVTRWHNSCPAQGHPCGPLVALSGRTSKSQLCSYQSPVLFQLHPTATWWAGSHRGPAHTSYKGLGKGPDPSERPGKGWGCTLSSFQCLPEKIRLKEQTKTPLSLQKRFRDDGEV